MKKLFYFIGVFLLLFSSCLDDLDLTPIDPDEVTVDVVYSDIDGYYSALAKIYAALSTTGQQGPAGDSDVGVRDEGNSSYVRCLWNLQVLTTDEAICAWSNDASIPPLDFISYSPANEFIEGIYFRIFQEVAFVNEFLRQTTDDAINSRGHSEYLGEIAQLRAEARVLRALVYWHSIDLFGDIPFITEDDPFGAFLPEQKSRSEVFDWLVAEVDDLISDLPEVNTAEYGRLDKGAAWMLKAKLYLNAEVYTGEAMYDEMILALNEFIDDYTFFTGDYGDMFLGDNNKIENPTASSGFILSVPQHGQYMQTFGASTFLTFSAIGGAMDAGELGTSGGWSGNRLLPVFVDQFDANDTRGMVEERVLSTYYASDNLSTLIDEQYTSGYGGLIFNSEYHIELSYAIDTIYDASQDLGYYLDTVLIDSVRVLDDAGTKEIIDPFEFSNGYGFMKYRNTRSDGTAPEVMDYGYPDFPMFRLADAYLMYAEGVAKGASGGDVDKAVAYVNSIRQRAFGDNSGDVTSVDLTDDFILAERSRELSWEGHRRQDLIRFGLYTSADYLWSWKGGVQAGRAVSDFYQLFPIPSSDINANPLLVQNEGY